MSFATRVFLGILAILVATVAALTLAADRWLRREVERRFAAELEIEARLVATALPHDTTVLAAAARRLGSMIGRRVTIIATDGQVLGDSDFDDAALRLLANHRDRPEVVGALRDGTGIDRRLSESEYLAGEFSIADIALYPTVAFRRELIEQHGELRHLLRWMATVAARPGVQRGMRVPA